MKKCNHAILLAMICLGLGSCSEDNPWAGSEGEGGISLKLSASAEVRDAIPVMRSGDNLLEAPDASYFAISLTNIATEEKKSWPTLSDFQNQKSFPVGSYTLSASYGSADEEGFDKPYFYGDSEVTVLDARTSEVEVLAQLANSMVSVDYTENFRNYFKSYGVTIHSEGHSYIDFAAEETRPAFIAPGEVNIAVNVTNPSGKSATLQPAAFPAQARHHYHITFDVTNSPKGDSQLQILFDDSIETEDVVIDMTEELFSSPAPAVNATGFSDGQVIEALEGNPLKNPARFNIIAHGGVSSVIMTINSDNFTPEFGNEIDLVKATPAQQSQIDALGIKVVGLYKNTDRMAYVDVTDLAAHLPTGKTSVTIVAKDAFTRISEPMTVNFTNVPIVLTASDGSAILGINNATIDVEYNGSDPDKNISFQALSKAGVYKDCGIIEVKESSQTRAFETKNYIFTIALPDTDHEIIPVKVFFGSRQFQEVSVKVTIPQYSIAIDPFSTFARVKVNTENDDELAIVTNTLKIFVGNNRWDSVSRNPESGIITISGLTPSESYAVGHALIGSIPSSSVNIKTEDATELPNTNFSQKRQTISKKIQVGGTYRVGLIDYTNWSTITVNEPEEWASVNAKTFYEGAENVNSWFTVVSTFMDNDEVVMRSVAYDHNGTTPARTGQFLTTTYYNTNSPSSFASKAAGELFLGSYSYNGSESRGELTSHKARPSSLSFDCSYNANGSDTGYAEISVLDIDKQQIAYGSADITGEGNHTVTIPLSGYSFGSKAAYIKVGFKSSKGDFSFIIPNPNVNAWSGTLPVTPYQHDLGENINSTFASGSELRISNVKLNY